MAEHVGAMLRDSVAPPARAFLLEQTTLGIGAVDGDERLWASLWLVPAGFARSHPEGRTVHLARPCDLDTSADPVWRWLRPGQHVGVLAIDLATRRRLRINGVVGGTSDELVELNVCESFPNCPKYIQRRERRAVPDEGESGRPAGPVRGVELDAERRAFVEQADTMIVASRHRTRGLDVSHRGGEPGFVRVVDARTLRVPDYPGNGMFQTLGNFEAEPRAGLAIVDFVRGRQLALTGSVRNMYGIDDPTHPTLGTMRYWEVEVESWIELSLNRASEWRLVDRSPHNPPART